MEACGASHYWARELQALGDEFEGAHVRWHIAKFCCNAKLGRYRGKAAIEQARRIPFNLAEATD